MKGKGNKKLLRVLGNRIRELREKQGISQAQLAFESGIHRDQVGRIELGKQNCTISTLAAIAEALDVRMGDILETE